MKAYIIFTQEYEDIEFQVITLDKDKAESLCKKTSQIFRAAQKKLQEAYDWHKRFLTDTGYKARLQKIEKEFFDSLIIEEELHILPCIQQIAHCKTFTLLPNINCQYEEVELI